MEHWVLNSFFKKNQKKFHQLKIASFSFFPFPLPFQTKDKIVESKLSMIRKKTFEIGLKDYFEPKLYF